MNRETHDRRFGRAVVRLFSSAVNLALLLALLLCLTFGLYALWDSRQVYQAAQTELFEIYKPTGSDGASFAELREQNHEVIGWLTVYGTGIDYPIVQAENNSKYLTMDAGGKFAASGSIFLDCKNDPVFQDFNSIVYGHHMDGGVMFGDVGEFADETYFQSHRYGYLHAGERDYGLEFFAFAEIDAYNSAIYAPGLEEPQDCQAYLATLDSLAMFTRQVDLTADDRIVLLSTCTQDITNGRHILAARILEDVPADPFEKPLPETPKRQFRVDSDSLLQRIRRFPTLVWAVLILLGLLLILLIHNLILKAIRSKKSE